MNCLPHDWFDRPLPENVVIGEGSWLYSSFAFLHCRSRRPRAVTIGRRSGIYNTSFFDLGPEAEVHIGDYCSIVGAVIHTNGRVLIHDYAFVAHEVTIASDAYATPGRWSASDAAIVIGRNAWIGARAMLLGGAHLGEGAIVGAAAVVDFEVPPYAIVAGNPASIVGWARPKDAGGL